MGWDGSWNPAGMFVMGIGMLLFWVLVIGAIVWVVRSLGTSTTPGAAPRTAREVLDERFARGEIDEDEYKRRRDALAA